MQLEHNVDTPTRGPWVCKLGKVMQTRKLRHSLINVRILFIALLC